MKRCVFCAEEIQDEAVVCKHCGRSVPAGAVRITYRGARYGIGEMENAYGVWDLQAGGAPLQTFEMNTNGWTAAWTNYQRLEGAGPSAVVLQRPQATNGMAVASLVLGILWLWWIGSILALIFGYFAKSQIDATGGVQQGRGLAIAGIVLGYIGLGLFVIYLLVVISAVGSYSGF